MSRVARDLAWRLAAAGVDASVIAALVTNMAAARAESINREGLEAQIAFLLEIYGAAEIETLAIADRRRQDARRDRD